MERTKINSDWLLPYSGIIFESNDNSAVVGLPQENHTWSVLHFEFCRWLESISIQNECRSSFIPSSLLYIFCSIFYLIHISCVRFRFIFLAISISDERNKFLKSTYNCTMIQVYKFTLNIVICVCTCVHYHKALNLKYLQPTFSSHETPSFTLKTRSADKKSMRIKSL